MQVIVCKNYDEISKEAAKIVASQVTLKPDSVLGLATGSSPEGLYKELIEMYKKGELDFSGVTSFNLDEYYPIDDDNDQSYHHFMKTKLFDHINIKESFVPNGMAAYPEEACRKYDELVESYGWVDLQILGIGQNGHIAFNEPDSELYAGTHVTGLTESTIEANSRFFASREDVPKKALTMGMATILKAKKIVLVANGKNKHEAIRELLGGKITTSNPSTFLNLHKDVVLIVDKEAYRG